MNLSILNSHDKNSNTFTGKARILFNNLPYQIRSISSFKSFSRELKKYLLDHVSLVTRKILFHFSQFINLFFYLLSHFERISQFCNLHAYLILLAYAGLMLYAIPSLLNIYTIDAHSIHFEFCNLIVFPSLLEQCYIFMQYLFVIYSSKFQCYFWSCSVFMQLQVSANSVVSYCFFYIRSIFFNSSSTTQSYSRFKVYYFDKFGKTPFLLLLLYKYI